MLANLNFGDFITRLDAGIPPGTSMAVGTTSGSALALNASARKLAFRLIVNSGTASTGTATLQLATATASNGTFTVVPGTSGSVAASAAGRWEVCVDTRNEAFCDLGTGALYVQPQVVVAGVALSGVLDVLGYDVRSEPASNNNAATVTCTTVTFD